MSTQKTPRMLAAEAGRGPIEKWLPQMIEEHGQSWTAETLGINRGTLRDWVLMLGLRFQRRVVGRNEP